MEFETTKEASTNLGELFNEVKAESKYGKRLKEQEELVEKAKEKIKEIQPGMQFTAAMIKYKEYLTLMYKGKALEKQLIFAGYKRTTEQILETAWTILLSRIEHFENNKKEFEELQGV